MLRENMRLIAECSQQLVRLGENLWGKGEKKKKEYDKGAKVRHKTKGMVETIVSLCKVKVNGAWVDGVIYEGNDTNTGEPITFVRVKEDFENNFELC